MIKTIAILCNRLAGSGRAVKMAEDIMLELTSHNIKNAVFINEWPLTFSYFTDIFIIGGDGTINYFVNKYPEIKLPIVIFNGGTGNDFHWSLYGNKSFKEQLQLALENTPRSVDLGKCNDRYFINGVGIGFEAAISKALTGKMKLTGKTSFLISVLKNIFTYKSKSYSVNISNRDITGKFLLIDIYNGQRAGGGFNIAPLAKSDDGLFDIIISTDLTSLKRLRYLPLIEKGKHLKLSFISYFMSNKIIIKSDEIIHYHLDGEYAEAEKLAIEILPSQLNFRY